MKTNEYFVVSNDDKMYATKEVTVGSGSLIGRLFIPAEPGAPPVFQSFGALCPSLLARVLELMEDQEAADQVAANPVTFPLAAKVAAEVMDVIVPLLDRLSEPDRLRLLQGANLPAAKNIEVIRYFSENLPGAKEKLQPLLDSYEAHEKRHEN